MIRDAEARRLNHGDVVGTIAGGERVLRRQVEPPGELDQGCELGLAPEDRLGHLAGQAVFGIDNERVGAVLVEPDEGPRCAA